MGIETFNVSPTLHLNVKLYFNVTSILVSELKYSLMGQTHFYESEISTTISLLINDNSHEIQILGSVN